MSILLLQEKCFFNMHILKLPQLRITFRKLMISVKKISSVQLLSCVQIFATHVLQNARPPCPSQLPKYTQTHVH